MSWRTGIDVAFKVSGVVSAWVFFALILGAIREHLKIVLPLWGYAVVLSYLAQRRGGSKHPDPASMTLLRNILGSTTTIFSIGIWMNYADAIDVTGRWLVPGYDSTRLPDGSLVTIAFHSGQSGGEWARGILMLIGGVLLFVIPGMTWIHMEDAVRNERLMERSMDDQRQSRRRAY